MKHKAALLLVLLSLILSSSATRAASNDARTLSAELIFTAADFTAAAAEDTAVTADGLTLANTADAGAFTSQPVRAPLAFNALVPDWMADMPETADLTLMVRTGPRPDAWGEWHVVHASADWTLPQDEETVGEMIFVPAVDNTHRYVQFSIHLQREASRATPLLRQLRFTFIDSTNGPTAAELVARQQELDATQRDATLGDTAAYAKPAVVSRAAWCTEAACNYSDGLKYHPVSHLILHHTVTDTGERNSAEIVRAIWRYHTFSRSWGDIGYNFLVDVNGVIYEGHLGGDDVVGIHAAGANTGSMGVSMIGTFIDVAPPPAMLESVINLFAWKASQRNIDVFGASKTLPGIAWGLPHVMGHRDVYGTTACPGDQAHLLIPAIRDQVAARLGQTPQHLYVDELSSAFTKSDANWYTPIYQCGHNSHAWYTWSTTDPAKAVNWGEWRPNIPSSGRYQIEVYVPYCNTGAAEATSAVYTVTHAGGSSSVVVDQNRNVGLWVSLGEYDLRAGNENVIHLTDLTTAEDGRGIWFDSLRLLPLEVQVQPSADNVAPGPDTWLNRRDVIFGWNIAEPQTVAATTVEVATDAAMANLVYSETWPEATVSAGHTFDQDYGELYWRVTLSTADNEQFASAVTKFSIDQEPPVSAVTTVLKIAYSNTYYVSWSGVDNLTGVAGYTLAYRAVGDADWTTWLSDTTATSGLFLPPDPARDYEFRSQASDNLGNQEPPRTTADLSSTQAVTLSRAIMLPAIIR